MTTRIGTIHGTGHFGIQAADAARTVPVHPIRALRNRRINRGTSDNGRAAVGEPDFIRDRIEKVGVFAMSQVEIRKQISIFVPLSDWRAIRQEAARLRIPITELCRRWMRPQIVQLRRRPETTRRVDGNE